jgi:hypothetical protein
LIRTRPVARQRPTNRVSGARLSPVILPKYRQSRPRARRPWPYLLRLAQQPLYLTVNLFPLAGLEPYFFRGQKKLLHLLPA